MENLLLAAAFLNLVLGPGAVRPLAWAVVAGWALLLFYQPLPVLGYGGPTWPLKPVVLAPTVLVALPGISPFGAALIYGLAYLYARTLGRYLLERWFGPCSGSKMGP